MIATHSLERDRLLTARNSVVNLKKQFVALSRKRTLIHRHLQKQQGSINHLLRFKVERLINNPVTMKPKLTGSNTFHGL